MAQRIYTVFLKGGASLTVRAARFEATEKGVFFYDGEGQPLEDTYIEPSSVIAVIPPGSTARERGFPSL
jgi:hypothetical protein